MLKIFCVVFFMAFTVFAQVPFEDGNGYVDLDVVEHVIVHGTEAVGSTAKLKTIIPKVIAVHRTKAGSITSDCSGVLIATNLVLTAAHCLSEDQSPMTVSVQFGKYVFMASHVVRHPGFSEISFLPFGKGHQLSGFNDIALVFLQRHVLGARPALLPPRRSQLAPGTSLILTGFGKTFKNGPKSKNLLTVEAPASEGTRSRIVVRGSKISCKGDSGSPALTRQGARFVVRGVTSAGDCETYAYYTRVSDYVDWILSEIAQFNSTDEI